MMLVIGEQGNSDGHYINMRATTDRGLRQALRNAVAPYKGDGWGRVYDDAGQLLYRIDGGGPVIKCG